MMRRYLITKNGKIKFSFFVRKLRNHQKTAQKCDKLFYNFAIFEFKKVAFLDKQSNFYQMRMNHKALTGIT